jgi:hypothetical protein
MLADRISNPVAFDEIETGGASPRLIFNYGECAIISKPGKRGRDVVRAQLDRPDFFEDFAGNHAGENNEG